MTDLGRSGASEWRVVWKGLDGNRVWEPTLETETEARDLANDLGEFHSIEFVRVERRIVGAWEAVDA